MPHVPTFTLLASIVKLAEHKQSKKAFRTNTIANGITQRKHTQDKRHDLKTYRIEQLRQARHNKNVKVNAQHF